MFQFRFFHRRPRRGSLTAAFLAGSLVPAVAALADGLTPPDLEKATAAAPNTGTALTAASNLSTSPITLGGSTSSLAAALGAATSAAAQAQSLAQGAVQAAGGDVSNTSFLPQGAGARIGLAGKLSRLPDPLDFGAAGTAVRGVLAATAVQGATGLVLSNTALSGGITIAAGAQVHAAAGLLPAGTTVTSVTQNAAASGGIATTTVVLSAGLLAPVAAGQATAYFDFATQDDTAAFQAAAAQAAKSGQNAVHVSPGLYALSGTIGPNPAIAWVVDNAMFSSDGSVADGPSAAVEQQPAGRMLLKTLAYPDNENGQQVDVNFAPTTSLRSYQKNAENISLFDSDGGCFQAIHGSSCNGAGGSSDIRHGAVGLTVQAQFGSAVSQGALWGQESLVTVPAGTDGTVTNDEKSLVNNSSRPAPYLGDVFNKEVATFLSGGSTPVSDTIRVGGVAKSINGVWVDAGDMLENALVVGQDAGRNAAGVGLGYTAYAWIGHAGDIFGTSAHFGGGTASATQGATPTLAGSDGRSLPQGGLGIDGSGNLSTTGNIAAVGSIAASGTVTAQASLRAGTGAAGIGGVSVASVPNGEIDIGNATLTPGTLPLINFHKASAAASDAWDLQIRDNGGAIWVGDGTGAQLLYASAAAGLQGTSIVATGINGVTATFNGPRASGNLLVNLTGSGFDMLQETGSQGLYIKTNGGYNAQFNADGTTSLNGRLARTAASSLSGSGTTQSGATALSAQVNLITACAGSANAFVLPTGAAAGWSTEIKLINRSGSSCQIFPPGGGAIEGGATNAPVSLASGSDASFNSINPNLWYQ